MSNDRIQNRNAASIINSRLRLVDDIKIDGRKTTEGGCGVIGILGTKALAGRMIIRSCQQMRNRGNGKGGGVAAAGLFPEDLKKHYALHIAYLDEQCRKEVEKRFVTSAFDVAHQEKQSNVADHRKLDLEVNPPDVYRYFVEPKRAEVNKFRKAHGIQDYRAAAEEFLFQNSFRLNHEFYVKGQKPQAFVLSQGRDLMILKAVGYAEQVARYYKLEDTLAHVWIGHQRYPTRGRVWHPGGAHPFAGLHEALVHNGDFANYHAVTEYLRQRGSTPLFVTDTEVSALLFDLHSRVLNYPLEYVIESIAPTPEGDFERLAKGRQRIYRALQTAHIHGSPDGPWFFIIARCHPQNGMPELIGITDVSMLRPQVFAIQEGRRHSFGAIGSEKQAIDAFFEEVAAESKEVQPVADRYWNARGGSCTDGGAFTFSLVKRGGRMKLEVKDKFGQEVTSVASKGKKAGGKGHPPTYNRSFDVGPARLAEMMGEPGGRIAEEEEIDRFLSEGGTDGAREERRIWGGLATMPDLQKWASKIRTSLKNARIKEYEKAINVAEKELGIIRSVKILTHLRDRKWDTGKIKQSRAISILEAGINGLFDRIPGPETCGNDVLRLDVSSAWKSPIPEHKSKEGYLVIDAKGFTPEGDRAVCRLIVEGHKKNWRNFIVYNCHGDRFIGCGLGQKTDDVKINIYGSSGDYLGSGMDGAEIYVHGNGQDQIGQILKSGRIVVYGDVGQTFLYGAKGGEVYVMGNAAGRPLINAVGKIKAVINGTCLDYCAESFMAGKDVGDGFVIINGIAFDSHGEVIGLETKYDGNNLFSLASGGACYLNDPYRTVTDSQLNGASFDRFRQDDWNAIIEYLRLNEQLFGLSIRHDLLMVDGVLKWPKEVLRKVVASPVTSKLDWSSMVE